MAWKNIFTICFGLLGLNILTIQCAHAADYRFISVDRTVALQIRQITKPKVITYITQAEFIGTTSANTPCELSMNTPHLVKNQGISVNFATFNFNYLHTNINGYVSAVYSIIPTSITLNGNLYDKSLDCQVNAFTAKELLPATHTILSRL